MKHLIAFFALLSTTAAFAVNVKEVKVKALDSFGGDTGSVVSRCQTKAGSAYDPVTVTRDVNSLKDSGEFEEINADAQKGEDGVSVTFFIKRKFRYQAPLVIVGNDFFSESKVAKEAELKDGYLYGESDLAAAAGKVRLAYQKKYYSDAKVTPAVEVGGGNNATVTLTIEEGVRQKVRDYVFDGCASIDEKELHEAIDDLPWWNPIGWFADDPVTKDQQAQCCDKVAAVYRNHGYLDVKVTGPERSPCEDEDGEKTDEVDVVFTVDEGIQYKIGKMSVKGLTRYPEAVVMEKSDLPATGTIAGAKILEDAAIDESEK